MSPYLIVHNPEMPNLGDRLKPPDFLKKGWSGYILGTDSLGRDVLSRLLVGSRYSFFISFISVLIAGIIGIFTGLLSGYYGGWVDDLIMRIGDIQFSMPPIVLAIVIVAALGPNIGNLIIVLVITAWIKYARVIRGNVLVIVNMEFISASKALGAGSIWIMIMQILPNVLTPILILISEQVGYLILLESALSFLGLGVQPPMTSWGVMISDGRGYIAAAPWVVLSPGIALMITVLGFNFLGDGLRDVLDPKMKS